MKLKINKLKPLFDGVITTADIYTKDESVVNGLYDATIEGSYKPYQKVVSISKSVADLGIKVGDLVLIDFTMYGKPLQVKDVNSINTSVEGYHVEMKYSIPVTIIDGKEHLFISVRAINSIIEEHEFIEDEVPLFIEEKNEIIKPNDKIIGINGQPIIQDKK